jgi:hypothetical protein
MGPIAELTVAQARQLAQELLEPRGGRVRLAIDGGVKVDVGWGWSPPIGTVPDA